MVLPRAQFAHDCDWQVLLVVNWWTSKSTTSGTDLSPMCHLSPAFPQIVAFFPQGGSVCILIAYQTLVNTYHYCARPRFGEEHIWVGRPPYIIILLRKRLKTLHFHHNRIYMVRFQLILLFPDHDVTNNLTGHKMHVKGPQIYQMNRQTNSFQNVYYVL